MQLLYGRDDSNYKILSKSSDLNEAATNILINYYLGYEFVKSQEKYSNVAKEPVSIAYNVTNLDGYLDEDMILISKSGRYLNYKTPSKYSHAKLFEIYENSFGKNFFDYFNYSFVESQETDKYTNDDIDRFEGSFIEIEKTEILPADALKKILYIIFDIYGSISKTLYIMIDQDGDNYNSRSIDVIRQIYSKIPYFMRRTLGFVSYGTFEQVFSSRIKIIVTPRCETNIGNKLVIDLANIENIKVDVTKEIKELVDYIFSLSENDKIKFFEIISKGNDIYSKNIEEIHDLFINIKNLSNKSKEDRMDYWIYNIINYNELSEEMFDIMLNDIKLNLDSKMFNDYLKYILSKPENKNLDYLSHDKELYKLLLFEDILSVDYKEDLDISIKIDVKYIVNWWKENIESLLKSKFTKGDLIEHIEYEIKKYKTLDLQGKNYNLLKNLMINQLEKNLEY